MLTTVPSCLASLMAVKPGSPDIETALEVVSPALLDASARQDENATRIPTLTLNLALIERLFDSRRVTWSRLHWVNKVVAGDAPKLPRH
jgi:hypothetical protein